LLIIFLKKCATFLENYLHGHEQELHTVKLCIHRTKTQSLLFQKLEQEIVGLPYNPSLSHMISVLSLLIYDYQHLCQDLPILAAVMDSDL